MQTNSYRACQFVYCWGQFHQTLIKKARLFINKKYIFNKLKWPDLTSLSILNPKGQMHKPYPLFRLIRHCHKKIEKKWIQSEINYIFWTLNDL